MTMTELGYRVCGSPKKNGEPCQQRLYGPADVSCKQHATDSDEAVADAYRRGHSDGWELGRGDFRVTSLTGEVERLKIQIAELREKLDLKDRYYNLDGAQVVECGRYAYLWKGTPLVVGEEVVVPANWLVPKQTTWTVTRLGTTYRGALSHIVRRA